MRPASAISLVPRRLRWPLRRAVRAARYGPSDVLDTVLGRRPPMTPPRRLMFVGGREFEAVGDALLEQFVSYGDLTPSDHVLDIGCGIGRAAIPLTRYLSAEGSYDGFDIVREGIVWCTENISSQRSNFRFQMADLHNSVYNSTGTSAAADYRFPYPDGSFDFAFATSVFTHMLPEEVTNYLGEIARVLKPGGTCFSTFFLINERSLRCVDAGESQIDLKRRDKVSMSTSSSEPEQAIAYEERFVREQLVHARLAIQEPIRYGVWSGGDSKDSFQDIVVSRLVEEIAGGTVEASGMPTRRTTTTAVSSAQERTS